MKEDIDKLMHAFPLRNGRKEYVSFDEILADYAKKVDYVTDNRYSNQNVNYLYIESTNRKVLEEIREMGWLLDEELYVSRIGQYEDRALTFKNEYELKEDEIFYVEIVPDNKAIIDFVRYDLCSYARNNKVPLKVECTNSDFDSSLLFTISELGELETDAKFHFERYDLNYCVYQVCMLKDIYGNVENMRQCLESAA